MIPLLIAIKVLVAVAVVIGLSIVTERSSPKLAGILAGLPTGSAISLFFIGLDNGSAFASNSAVYNIMGLVAMQVLLFSYYKASSKFKKHNIVLSALVSIAAYFVTVYFLQFITQNIVIALVLSCASVVFFGYLFKDIENTKIRQSTRTSIPVLLVRAIAAAVIILIVIESASLVGPKWSGLFSAFPTTTFPLLLIIHYTYDKKHVQTIIKNVPVGLSSLIAYSLTVSLAYPIIGIYYGTVAAYLVAFVV
ncbi:MAG: hypothetical protein KGH67_04650, partial [Candidatus Micrarchaeota archaeon]|nr:hypothetical protein [Candidatus Micrarchaeota archaeon]